MPSDTTVIKPLLFNNGVITVNYVIITLSNHKSITYLKYFAIAGGFIIQKTSEILKNRKQ